MIAPRKKRRKLIVPRGSLFPAAAPGSPYAQVPDRSAVPGYLRAIGLALGVHAALAVAVLDQRRAPQPAPPPPHREIAAAIVHAAPPPPPPPPPAPRPTPVARTAPRPLRAPPATPPPPAQAGKAIAVDGPADLTSFDLVVGQGTSYAGGISAANGTNKTAVHEVAQIGAPPRRETPAQDLSRPAAPLSRDWVCPWPDAAQDSDVRDARVTARIHITSDGDASQVDIVAAPPTGGFAEAAHRCATEARYRPALDASGTAIAAAPLFNIRFSR